MSSKRGTNNSTVVSLEDQTRIIQEMSETAGLKSIPDKSGKTSSEKSKVGKKTKPKAKNSANLPPSGALDIQGPQSLGEPASQAREGRPGRHVTSASGDKTGPSSAKRGGGATNHVGPSAAAGSSHGNVPSNDEDDMDAIHDVTPNQPGASGDSSRQQHGDEEFDVQEYQRQWMLQQHQWQMQFQPFGLNPYGNLGFNPGFGEFNQIPDWMKEVPEQPEEGSQTAPGAVRQATHEISDEEEDSAEALPQVEREKQDALPQGKTATKVKEQLEQVKEADKVSPPLDKEVADLLSNYLRDALILSEMEKLAKKYPRVENCERMRVQRLDAEIFHVIDQTVKGNDQNMQGIQKGILGAMSAFSPVLELVFRRKADDPELDDLGENIMEGMQLLAYATNALAGKRRDLLKPLLTPVYARAMSKGHEDSEWLYGGDLAETTKQCELVKKLGEKVLKRKPFPPNRGRGGFQKRFRPAFGQFNAQPAFRPANPMQVANLRFNAPQMFYPQQQQQMQMQQTYPMVGQTGYYNNNGGFGIPRRYRNPRPRQGFGKRGSYQK